MIYPFRMFIGHIGKATVVVSVDTLTDEDTQRFKTHWKTWLNLANQDDMCYNHLIKLTTNNSLALNENSSTITSKWTNLFKQEEGWKFFFDSAPFNLSVTKVSSKLLFFIFIFIGMNYIQNISVKFL